MQMWSSDENSVCLSVCPSVTHVDCDKTVERSFQIYTTNIRKHLTSFSEKKNGWWGRPLLPEILGQLAPVGA